MIPVVTGVRLTGAAHRAELPLLVLGPAPGTTATELWSACAVHLRSAFDLVAWDLPGHGHNRSVPDEGFTTEELAEGVLALVADIQDQRGDPGTPFAYAGVSVGGEVGLTLLLDHAHRVTGAALIGAEGVRGVGDDRLVVLEGATHLAPIERPDEVAELLRGHFLGEESSAWATDLTRELRELVATRGANGIWTRPGLDLRSRSMIALTALAARGEHEELARQLRDARGQGLSWLEIKEVLLQTAVHSGVSMADLTFRIAQQVHDEEAPA